MACVLLVGLISFTMIRYGENKAEIKTVIQSQQNYIDTRKRIDSAVKGINNRDDVGLATEWLRERQNRR